MEDNTKGNPDPVENAVFGPGSDFFDQLESSVNGAIADNTQEANEVTPPHSDPEQATHTNASEGPNETVDWEKRYKDSSKSAQKMYGQLKNLKPFVPVLEAMKNDSGLVQHVRDYLENGGAPVKSVQERLGLAEDFVYDQQEALENPESDSAKVFSAHVDSMVNGRVNQILSKEKQQAQLTQIQIARKREEAEFREKHKMSDEDIVGLMGKAREHIMTLEDIHHIVNRDKSNAKVANSTKQDMLNQMKNVRDIPGTASGANNQDNESLHFEDEVFNSLLGSDDSIDNLFG